MTEPLHPAPLLVGTTAGVRCGTGTWTGTASIETETGTGTETEIVTAIGTVTGTGIVTGTATESVTGIESHGWNGTVVTGNRGVTGIEREANEPIANDRIVKGQSGVKDPTERGAKDPIANGAIGIEVSVQTVRGWTEVNASNAAIGNVEKVDLTADGGVARQDTAGKHGCTV